MLHDRGHVLKPSNVVDSRAEVESLENISERVKAHDFFGALGHDGTEGLETGQGSVSLQSGGNVSLVMTPLFAMTHLTTAFFTSSLSSPSVFVLRLLTPSRSITETFLISQPSSALTQSSPGPRQSWEMKGILLTRSGRSGRQVFHHAAERQTQLSSGEKSGSA